MDYRNSGIISTTVFSSYNGTNVFLVILLNSIQDLKDERIHSRWWTYNTSKNGLMCQLGVIDSLLSVLLREVLRR